MDKYAPDDIPNINSTCFKLNSLQLQALLQNYHCAPDEPFIPTVSGCCLIVTQCGTCLHREIWMKKQKEVLFNKLTYLFSSYEIIFMLLSELSSMKKQKLH